MHETLFLAIFFTLLAIVSSEPQRSGASDFGFASLPQGFTTTR